MNKNQARIYYKGAYYHIYNRGNNKQNIFLDNNDYIFYLKRLRDYKKKHNTAVLSYCLMPNHIHLVIGQNTEIPVYKLILSLHTSYSMYFNKKYNKIGHVFQGRFGCKVIDKDEYLLHLSSYIHLNPLSAGLVKKLEDYQWSSYPDYIGTRAGTLCDKDVIMGDNSPEWYKRVTEEEVVDLIAKKKFQIQEKLDF